MAGHETSEVVGIAIDNSSGTLTDISGDVNTLTWEGGQELLDDTGMGDGRHTVVAGLANASNVPLNGWVNSTIRAIFLPVVDGTSVTKTVEIKVATGEYWTGEVWPETVTGISANVGQLNTWSCTLRAQNGLTQTSVTAVV